MLFDVFGTVVDWRAGVAAAVGRFADQHGIELDAEAFADAWRARYAPGMRRVSSGDRPFETLDVLHRENLDGVLADLGLDPERFGPAALDELNRAWHFLPPWPDSVAGITALKRDYIVGPLSNGNTSLLLDMSKAGGLSWDLILGSDVTRAYKPTMEAYLRPAALLALKPGQIMLAAAHESDLTAARTAGFAAAFISRPLEHGPGIPGAGVATQSWDLAVSSITELADRMGSRLRRLRRSSWVRVLRRQFASENDPSVSLRRAVRRKAKRQVNLGVDDCGGRRAYGGRHPLGKRGGEKSENVACTRSSL